MRDAPHLAVGAGGRGFPRVAVGELGAPLDLARHRLDTRQRAALGEHDPLEPLVRGERALEDGVVLVDQVREGLLGEGDGPSHDLFRAENHDFTPLHRASSALAATFDTTRWS